MALPLQIGTEISRVLRDCGCRNFFFNELTEGGTTVGAFVLTPDFTVTIATTDAVVCRGSWMLGTACGHCSRCVEEAPRGWLHKVGALSDFSDDEIIREYHWRMFRRLGDQTKCIQPAVPP